MQSGREGWIECFSFVNAVAYLTNKLEDNTWHRAEKAALDLASMMDAHVYASLLIETDPEFGRAQNPACQSSRYLHSNQLG